MGNTKSDIAKRFLEVTNVLTGGNFGISEEGLHLGPLRLKKNGIGVRFNYGAVKVGLSIYQNNDGTWKGHTDIGIGIPGLGEGKIEGNLSSDGTMSVGIHQNVNFGSYQSNICVSIDQDCKTSMSASLQSPAVDLEVIKHGNDECTFSAAANFDVFGPISGNVNISYKGTDTQDMKWETELQAKHQSKEGQYSGIAKGKVDQDMKWNAGIEAEIQSKDDRKSGLIKYNIDQDIKYSAVVQGKIKSKYGKYSVEGLGQIDQNKEWTAEVQAENQSRDVKLSGMAKGKVDKDMEWNACIKAEIQSKDGRNSGLFKCNIDKDMKCNTEVQGKTQSKDGEYSDGVTELGAYLTYLRNILHRPRQASMIKIKYA